MTPRSLARSAILGAVALATFSSGGAEAQCVRFSRNFPDAPWPGRSISLIAADEAASAAVRAAIGV
jgi:hypothetical protein